MIPWMVLNAFCADVAFNFETFDKNLKGGKFIDTQQIFVSVHFMSVRNRYLRFFLTRVWLIRQPVQLANLPNVWFAKDNT